MRACRMSCAQQAVEPELAEPHDEAKSKSSTVRSISGSTTAALAKCGVAPSGDEPSTRKAQQFKATLSLSSNSAEPEETIAEEEQVVVEARIPAWKKETWCCVENMPRESWLRRRRKHWPDQSKSTVFMDDCKIEEEPRCEWLVHTKLHDERRHHFPGRRNSLTTFSCISRFLLSRNFSIYPRWAPAERFPRFGRNRLPLLPQSCSWPANSVQF